MAASSAPRGGNRGAGPSGRLLGCSGAALVLAAAIAVSGCGASQASKTDAVDGAHHASSHPARTLANQHVHESIVATAASKGSVPIYRSPSAGRPFQRLDNPTLVGEPLVFLVKRHTSTGWEQVYLPVRPDESTGWIKDRFVRLTWNPYSLRVRLATHQLFVYKRGRVVFRFPAAVGRSVLPTPHGRYYLVDLLKQPDPNGVYGPYAYGTSAYSHVLYSFGGGPGEIGIHGTDEPGSIGHSVSHGCIRLPNADIARLARILPLGTPVAIGP